MKPSTRLIFIYDVRSQRFVILLVMCLVYGVISSVFCLVSGLPIVGYIFGAATLIGIMVLAVRIVQRQFAFRGMFENWTTVEVSLSSVKGGEGNELAVGGKYELGDRIVYFDTKVPLWMRTITLEPGDKLAALIDPQKPPYVITRNLYNSTSPVILRDLYISNWGQEAHISWLRINPIDYLPIRQYPNNLAFFFGLAGVLVGLFLFNALGKIGQEIVDSQKWPSTDGTILFSYVNDKVEYEKDSQGHPTPYPVYCPVIGYRYQVAGIKLTDQTYELGSECGRGATWASEVVAQYKAGDSVVVYYNPKMPSEAILHQKQWSGTDTVMIVIVVLVIILPSLGAMLFAMIFGLLQSLIQGIEWDGN